MNTFNTFRMKHNSIAYHNNDAELKNISNEISKLSKELKDSHLDSDKDKIHEISKKINELMIEFHKKFGDFCICQ